MVITELLTLSGIATSSQRCRLVAGVGGMFRLGLVGGAGVMDDDTAADIASTGRPQ